MSKPLLEIRELGVSYQRVRAVSDVDLKVEAGQVVALLGANGAGKTSMLRAISGLVKPDAGSAHALFICSQLDPLLAARFRGARP